MCLIRQRDLSCDDLAFLSSRPSMYAPDESAIARSLAIHEPPGDVDFGPVAVSQIVRFIEPRRSPHPA